MNENGKIRFLKIQSAFTPTELLQRHLKKYFREYGCGGRENLQWKAETFVWQIVGDNSAEMGVVWLPPINEKPNERDFLMAVYDEYAHQNIGNSALNFVESTLKDLGIERLRCQVNSNQSNGIFVRKWLRKNGFKLYDRNPAYASMTDEQYMLKLSAPVYFEKTYA